MECFWAKEDLLVGPLLVFLVTQNVPTATIVPTIPKTIDIVSPVETIYPSIRREVSLLSLRKFTHCSTAIIQIVCFEA
jgi:hypothetical protein